MPNNSSPWAIVGDFNTNLSPEDKKVTLLQGKDAGILVILLIIVNCKI